MVNNESFVWLLVVKGNLKHRIELLGYEKDSKTLRPEQIVLRETAQRVYPGEEQPERPTWAHGAFVYLTPEDARQIQENMKEHGTILKSKHILISDELLDTLQTTLEHKSDGERQEAFPVRRAGEIQTAERIPIKVYGYDWMDLHNMRKSHGGDDSDADNADGAGAIALESTPVDGSGDVESSEVCDRQKLR